MPEETERLPWCPECEVIAVPTEYGECGACGAETVLKEGVE